MSNIVQERFDQREELFVSILLLMSLKDTTVMLSESSKAELGIVGDKYDYITPLQSISTERIERYRNELMTDKVYSCYCYECIDQALSDRERLDKF